MTVGGPGSELDGSEHHPLLTIVASRLHGRVSTSECNLEKLIITRPTDLQLYD